MSHPEITGTLPEELRPILDQPLPDSVRPIRTTRGITSINEDVSHTEQDLYLGTEYLQLFREVSDIGGMALLPNTRIEMSIMQGPAYALAFGSTRHRRLAASCSRVIVSNCFGTHYENENGTEMVAESYGILRIDAGAEYWEGRTKSDAFRSRLQITRIPIDLQKGRIGLRLSRLAQHPHP